MNKKLMLKLYDKHGEDLDNLLNKKCFERNEPKGVLLCYKHNWKEDYTHYEDFCDEFILAETDSPAGCGKDGWEVVCTLQEYRDFVKGVNDEKPIYTINLEHPLAHNIKVYDFMGNKINNVREVEIYKDTVYVTILSEPSVLGNKESVAEFRGEVKGAKIVYQHKGCE